MNRTAAAPQLANLRWWIGTTRDPDRWRQGRQAGGYLLFQSADSEEDARKVREHFRLLGMGEDQDADDEGRHVYVYYERR